VSFYADANYNATHQADVKELAAMNLYCVVASRRLCVGQNDAQKQPDTARRP